MMETEGKDIAWREDFAEMAESISASADRHDLSDDEREGIAALINSPLDFIRMTLKIQNKRQELVPLEPNLPQQMFYDEYRRQEEAGRPVRIIILKARQMGFSTMTSALFYHKAVTTENARAMIVAHKADASTNIFEKCKLYYDCSPEFLRPMRKASNAKELVFENPSTNGRVRRANPGLRSKIEIETAANKEAGRSSTIHYLHISELAFWPHPEETMTALMQVVPNVQDTAVIIESTANGVGDYFHRIWKQAESGESPFVPLFFPWFMLPEYRMKPPADFQVTDEEAELQEKFSLDESQLAWRRWCITANCGGDVNKFHQEYPSTPNEAFLFSGRPVFDVQAVEAAMNSAKPAAFIGSVQREGSRLRFRTEPYGCLKVWEKPEDGEDYIIGIDVAEGRVGGDFSVMSVFRHRTMEQVAEWHGHIAPDLLGEEANLVGRWYNLAWIIPEANNHGISTIDTLRRLRYPKIYRRRSTPDKLHERNQLLYGFWTSAQSKKMMIDTFAKFLREGAGRIRSREALDECLSYVYDEKGASNAQEGCYDDRVIAAALAVHGGHIRRQAQRFAGKALGELYTLSSYTGY